MRDADNKDVVETDDLEIVDLDESGKVEKKLAKGQRLTKRTRAGLTVLSVVGGIVLLFVIVFSTHMGSFVQKQGPPRAVPIATTNLNDKLAWWSLGQDLVASRMSGSSSSGTASVTVFQKSNGHRLWESNAYVDLPFNGILGENYVFYTQMQDASIQAVHLDTGKVIWQSPALDGQLQALDRGILYLIGRDANIYAFRSTDGKLLWKQSSMMVGHIADQQKTIMVSGGIVVVSATDGNEVDAWRGSDGMHLWAYTKNGGGWVEAIQDGIVYMISQSHTIDAVKAADGTALWSYLLQNVNPIDTTIVKVTKTLIAVSTKGAVSVLRISDGARLWSNDLVFEVSMVQSDESLGRSIALFYRYDNSQKIVQALKWEDGSVVWMYKSSREPTHMMEKDGIIYAEYASFDGNVLSIDEAALRADNGVPIWSYKGSQGETVIGADVGVVYIQSQQKQEIEAIRMRDHRVLWQQHL